MRSEAVGKDCSDGSPWHTSHRESDGGYSLSEPVHFPSSHRIHQWGSASLGGSAALPLPGRASDLRSGPRFGTPCPEGPCTQRTISHKHPLFSKPDEVISPPTVWARPQPYARILKYLGGAGVESPRLGPFDRTVHQRVQDVGRGTSYCLDYCRPAAMRTYALPPLDKRVPVPEEEATAMRWIGEEDERTPAEIRTAARFGLTAAAASVAAVAEKAALDAPYGTPTSLPPRPPPIVATSAPARC